MDTYLKRCWYVAAHGHELSAERLTPRKLLGEDLVLYRQADGRPVAFIDRCVHRLAPLSAGRLEGERLRCMYHGLLFDPDGRCVEVPGQERIGPNLKLRPFRVVERDKLIWIWMGEAELADEALIPDAHWLDDPAWRAMPGYLHYERANYVSVIDNLLDFSHLGFVHENTLGGGKVSAQVTPVVERFDWGLKISRIYRNTPLAPYLKNLASFDGLVDRWQIYEFRLAGNVLSMDFGSAPAGSGALEGNPPPEALVFHTVQALTPETTGSTHYFWTVANNFKLDDPSVTAEMHRQTEIAFDEDRAIIQAQQAVLDAHPNEKMVGIAADLALNQGRSILQRMLAAEAAAPVRPLEKAG
jgi:phenylpropionate dioxygenase-like ring-hydroxylating dioxygenase large terminal subunit